MRKKMLARGLALVLALVLLTGSCLAAGEDMLISPAPAPIPAWAYGMLADGYAMGLFGDEIYTQHAQTVTMEQIDTMARVVSDKLALLGVERREADTEGLVLDTTRGGVVNALYQAAADYAFPGVEQSPEDFMVSMGALAGDGTGLHLERPCSLVEAATMANTLILALYDRQNAGSLGLLWKAEGNGNTLYLLGSIHTDRNNVYPFHKQLRDIILNAEQVFFELDFNDQAGLAEFAAMQVYSDGTTLADHVSPELYQAVVNTLGRMGMGEELVSRYKAWALATSLQSLATTDETTGSNAMAIDLYVNAKAANAGIDIGAVETYAFQGGIFDGLSQEYQEVYLASALLMVLDVNTMDEATRKALTDVLGEDALTADTQAALEEELAQIGLWMDQWKARDTQGFGEAYPKDAVINSDDELNSKLFTDRDPGMIAYADAYLKQSGTHTGLLVVGAGHMIGSGGIVQGLKDLGYTVEVAAKP